MSEHRKSSEHRLFALFRYMRALELGDSETLTVVLNEASHDRALGALLEELDTIYQTIDRTHVSDMEAHRVLDGALLLAQNGCSQQAVLSQVLAQRNGGTFPNEPETLGLPQVHHHHQSPRRSRGGRRLQLFAALLVICMLIGGMAAVSYAIHQQQTANSPSAAPTGTPSNALWGQTLYSTPAEQMFYDLVLSPDGQRIAVLNGDTIQVWDATTGSHLISISLAGGVHANLVTWSPNGKWLALASSSGITIIDAHTGAVVHQFPPSFVVESPSLTHGPNPLAVTSGGGRWAAYGLVWSPDSRLLAVTTYSPAASVRYFSILNAQTGALVHRFDTGGNWIIVTGWSSDGKYLAARVGYHSNSLSLMAWVWDMSTYQVVFQHTIGLADEDGPDVGDYLVWQPHSDNLAFAQAPSQTSGPILDGRYTGIALWDVRQQKQIKHYTIVTRGLLALSPDDAYIATVNENAQLLVIEVQSGRQIYASRPFERGIAFIAWSSDGRYIAVGPYTCPAPILILSAG